MSTRLKPLPTAAVAACLIGAAVFASLANGYYVFIIATMALTAIVGIGLNVLVGLTGQVSFGHVGFYAIGAYTVAILTTAARLPFTLALVLAALLSGLTGALLALPALRVRGPYLAMITIAFGPEGRLHYEDLAEGAYSCLLIELCTLRQVSFLAEVVYAEERGAALYGGLDQRGGVYVNKIIFGEELERGHDELRPYLHH